MSEVAPRLPTVYTIPEAARLLKLSDKTVYRLCRSNRIGHHRTNIDSGKYLFSQSDIDRYLADTHRPPQTP